jgi:predicted ATPase
MLDFLKLTNVGPAPALEVHFKRRMNFLTGDNGLGKTFLLDIAWWVLTRTWSRLPATPPTRGWKTNGGTTRGTSTISYGFEKARRVKFRDESIFDYSEQYWPVKPGRPPSQGIVIYAQADGGFSTWDPARNSWKEKVGDKDGRTRPSAFSFRPDQVWEGLIDGSSRICNGLILDWASWQREKGDSYSQLTSVLQALSPSRTETLRPGRLVRIGLEDARDQPTLTAPYGQEVPIILASAGIKRILALAYLLVWTWQEHLRASEIRRTKPASEIVFLIDEIEAHLHPQWQRRIVRALLDVMKVLTGTDTVSIQLISTTHSPLVLASIEPYFSPAKDAIWELDLVNDRVDLKEFPFRRLGDVNRWLTSTAFDLAEPRGLEAEEALQEALGLLRKSPAPPLKQFQEVDQKLRRLLGDVDPFWIRWSQHLDQLQGKA